MKKNSLKISRYKFTIVSFLLSKISTANEVHEAELILKIVLNTDLNLEFPFAKQALKDGQYVIKNMQPKNMKPFQHKLCDK